MLIGRGLVERSFSQYEEEERLYSTGNDELDDLLERAFCDGYQYAQVEFAEKEDKKDKEDSADDIEALNPLKQVKSFGLEHYRRCF